VKASLFSLLVVSLAACSSGAGSSTGEATAPTSEPASAGSARVAQSATMSAEPVAAGPLDPRMVALTKDILKCTYKSRAFLVCDAANTFRTSNDEYWKTPEADQALVDMLSGPDEKLAVIAAKRDAHDAPKTLADKARVERLFAAVERPGNPDDVQSKLIIWLANADFEKLGLGDRLKALAKNADVAVRRSVASNIARMSYGVKNPSAATAVELDRTFLADADPEVVSSAALDLGAIADDDKTVCDLLSKAIEKADEKTDHVLWSAATTHECKGLPAKTIEYVDKKTTDPAKVTKLVGVDYARSVESACRYADDPMKKKGYAVGLRLADSKVLDGETRYAAMGALVQCDEKGAKAARAVIEKMTTDQDKFVSDAAKKRLAELDKKK
jgi:hypothetical protein